MSIDGRGPVLARDAQERIAALASRLERTEARAEAAETAAADLAARLERVGAGLWQVLAAATVAAAASPGEDRLVSRVQMAADALNLWDTAVNGDDRG